MLRPWIIIKGLFPFSSGLNILKKKPAKRHFPISLLNNLSSPQIIFLSTTIQRSTLIWKIQRKNRKIFLKKTINSMKWDQNTNSFSLFIQMETWGFMMANKCKMPLISIWENLLCSRSCSIWPLHIAISTTIHWLLNVSKTALN